MQLLAQIRHKLGPTASYVLAGLLIVCGLLGCLWLLLEPVAGYIGGAEVAEIRSPERRAAAVNAVRQTLLAAAGGTAALAGLAFTARTYYLARRGQLTNRFSNAVSFLDSVNQSERIGAIYSHEQIMRESSADHDSALEVLAAFVREKAALAATSPPAPSGSAPLPSRQSHHLLPHPKNDVQAALDAIARRPIRPERDRIILTNLDLRGAHLAGARLRNVFLTKSRLESAYMRGADLRGAVLTDTTLDGANLRDAALDAADLQGATLAGAALNRASLNKARVLPGQLTQSQIQSLRIAPS